jgi:hypothetical protein
VLLDLSQAPMLAQLFETDQVILGGFETAGERRVIQGAQAGGSAPLAAVALQADGTEAAGGFLFVDQATGFLQVANPNQLLAAGSLRTRRLLNE